MKKCPYCAEQIQSEAIKCRYCGSMLPGEGAGPSAIRASNAFDETIRGIARDGRKIEAIKLVREKTGIGLKEAKEYVQRLEPGARQRTSPGCVVVLALLIVAGIVYLLLR